MRIYFIRKIPGESEYFRWVSPRLFRVSFPVTSRSRSRSGGGGDKIIVMWSAERSVPSQWEKTREQRTSWQQLTSFQWFTDWQFVWRVSCDSEIRPRWVDGEQSSVKSCHQSQSDRHHHITTAGPAKQKSCSIVHPVKQLVNNNWMQFNIKEKIRRVEERFTIGKLLAILSKTAPGAWRREMGNLFQNKFLYLWQRRTTMSVQFSSVCLKKLFLLPPIIGNRYTVKLILGYNNIYIMLQLIVSIFKIECCHTICLKKFRYTVYWSNIIWNA